MKAKTITMGWLAVSLCGSPSNAAETSDWATYWNSLPVVARTAYLDGFVAGTMHAYLAASEWLPPGAFTRRPEPENVAKVRKGVFLLVDREAIIKVMEDLYSDPANAYIAVSDMVYLARDKLLGEAIEPKLRAARNTAHEGHRKLKEMGLDR